LSSLGELGFRHPDRMFCFVFVDFDSGRWTY